jgi:WD40 repeat protein
MGNPLESDSFPYAFRVSDSRTVWIAQEDPYLGHFDWSPDSLFLASLSPVKPETGGLPADAPKDQNYIVLFGLDESRHYIALDEKGYDPVFGARWFPDRSAFLLFRESDGALSAVTTEGELRNTIAALEQAPSFVSWSPDGEWIALIEPPTEEGAGGTLMVVRPDGSDLRILARGVGDAPLVWV